ncbi:Phosphoglycerate mutase-like protein AT74 [Striga hermonthica]|uniref:Phosphoglycerate mutase-like protein AT74 n=1 Tax=Striga hermonthica TaxID=68872 RepID=A0A9N7N6T1_STRHE|nr:Phosphoglycerate mutase-like protein AT74 [Striga hermonthica]
MWQFSSAWISSSNFMAMAERDQSGLSSCLGQRNLIADYGGSSIFFDKCLGYTVSCVCSGVGRMGAVGGVASIFFVWWLLIVVLGNLGAAFCEISAKMLEHSPKQQKERALPKRIILVRHGESAGNVDGTAYATTPDNKIPLTPQGVDQAKRAGSRIYDAVNDGGRGWKVYFYVSPYLRTRSTLREIGRAFPRNVVIGAREECRIREQDFGNFQIAQRMKVIKETRERFGRFFYRFPEGESAADVYDRVSSFLESLWRDIDMNRLHHDLTDDLNLIIVSHGLAIRVFLMKWFKWTVEQFEFLNNLGNCEFRVMQLGNGGEYSLAINHSDEEMQEWGLSPDMIADQKWRAHASKGEWYEKCPWYLDTFFDQFADSSGEDGEDLQHC